MTDAFFSTIDQVAEQEKAKTERANAPLSESQAYIDYGNKAILLTPSLAHQALVVGKIVMPEDWADLRLLIETLSTGAPPNERVPSDEELRERHEKGYRLGLWFGPDFPIGYVASYHISRLFPLADDEFEGIREVDCDPKTVATIPFFKRLEDTILTAVEAHPDSPYRKRCENRGCGSGRVVIAEYYEAMALSPISLRMNIARQALDVLTGHSFDESLVSKGKRVFHCLECKWESEPLSEDDYPEVHMCNSHRSSLEALYDIERFVI